MVVLAIADRSCGFRSSVREQLRVRIQAIEIPSRNIRFVLLIDFAGFGDRAWYVYELPAGADLSKRMKTGCDTEGVLFWNYTEVEDHYEDPKIEILTDRYLEQIGQPLIRVGKSSLISMCYVAWCRLSCFFGSHGAIPNR